MLRVEEGHQQHRREHLGMMGADRHSPGRNRLMKKETYLMMRMKLATGCWV